MSNQQATADKLLYLLKMQGAQTAQALAKLLEMTPMGARQHLLQLESQGLVKHFSRAGKVGRPRKVWQLTDEAQLRFPDRHGQLVVNLLNSAQATFGEAGVEQLIAQRAQEAQRHYQQALRDTHSLTEKLSVLCQLRNAEGYMAEWFDTGENTYCLVENHCPICAAATRCRQFCHAEAELFQTVLGDDVDVERIEHILEGKRRCTYQIKQCAANPEGKPAPLIA